MLDILESLNKIETKAKTKEHLRFSCVAFTQTKACRELIEGAFRFEGIPLPSFVSNSDDDIQSHVRESNVEMALVELNHSDNVAEDMRRISHLLPNSASVIVIGQEDAISTIRNLKEMGFYYLFWPVTKEELIEFTKNVGDNRSREQGLGKKREAKNIAVWGCKGGVGTSLIASEIVLGLAKKHHSKCLLVDHDYYAGNLDILLKLEGFEKKAAAISNVGTDLDTTYAMSMTRKVDDLLSLLSVGSDIHPVHELKEYTRALEYLLKDQYNFIVEDMSKSAQTNIDYQYLVDNVDTMVLVFTPMISSLRQLKMVITRLEKESPNTRQIIVLNHTQPAKAAPISRREIEDFLERKVDVEIPFELTMLKHVLDGGSLFSSRLPVARPILQLIAMILGESLTPKKTSIADWLLRKRSA
ncbi:AAA family ATPase [Vibrio renipiscarius]|uniref:Chromosome partitioning protein ParA n=1 Tax=Vibrio renipiscarius TaxID=1461322 RepID=A0A0C2K245_9VIBR|nr:chromosome partitioning protein ParA [Vibrio renipiscarius]KII76013.1 chromosome partitioning protein ParA [Vibrio renipiscarius]KII79117.1 chromosome partitioning protein ParA [Vibrio renipiscarius]